MLLEYRMVQLNASSISRDKSIDFDLLILTTLILSNLGLIVNMDHQVGIDIITAFVDF